MKQLLFFILFFPVFLLSQTGVVHRYGIDTTNVNGVDEYSLIDTSFYPIFRGGQQKISIDFEPVDSIQQITNFFVQKLDSEFRDGESGAQVLGGLSSAIQTFTSFAPLFSTINGTSLVRAYGNTYGPGLVDTFQLRLLTGSFTQVVIEPVNELGNYQLRRLSDDITITVIPLPNNMFYMPSVNLGDGSTEFYFWFKSEENAWQVIESQFNKKARAVLIRQ